MNNFNKYIIKYVGVYILMFIAMKSTQNLFPNLYTITNESGTIIRTSLFAQLQSLIFALIPAFFVLVDLRKHSKSLIFIPLLTVLNVKAGLIFLIFAAYNNFKTAKHEQG